MEPYLLGDQRGADFDLDVMMMEASGQLLACWQYNTDLFDASTVQRMAGHFQNLLEGIFANPEQRISELPLLTESERIQLLVEWNNTQTDFPDHKCIHQLFEEQVQRTPNAVAVEFGTQQLTYSQLNNRANQLANYLQSLGVGPEVLVGICVERSPLMVVGLLGILKAGGAYVPLDPAYPPERLTYMLSDARVSVLLTQGQLVDSLPKSGAQLICLDGDWEAIAAWSEKNPPSEVKAGNLAYVIYTSGSTGSPKGVTIEHRSLVNFTQTAVVKYGISSRDKVLQIASISFDAAAGEIYPCLTSGGTLVLGTSEILSSVSMFLQKCREWQLTVLVLPTAYWHQLTSELATTDEIIPSSVRLVIIGGEAAQLEALKLWQKYVDAGLRRHKFVEPLLLINAYGPSETTVDATTLKLSEFLPTDKRALLPIGCPIANVKAYILDPYLQPVPVGIPGELYIGGVCLARGYLNRPDLTAEKFIPNPFKKSERLYKTGDKARYLPDANIEFIGRIDNQVKIRGFRIELGEIEAMLNSHPTVQEAVVVDREDVPGQKRLVAYLVAKQGQINPNNSHYQLSAKNLRVYLTSHLPYYMVPAAIVTLSALPLTPNGKIDRRALPAPSLRGCELEEDFVPPRTPVEEVLAGIWAQVLGVERIGIHDNFLELGGHSLLGIQVISRVRDTFGVELSLRCLFEMPTVAELAQYVEKARQQGPYVKIPPIQPVSRDLDLPLSFGQQQLWVLNQLEPDTPVYNEPSTIRLTGDVNAAALEKALNEIVRRHEILRTSFRMVNGQPIQAIAPALTVPLPVVDLRSHRASSREAEALRLATESARQPFDLTTGPLLRAILVQLDEADYRLFLTIHHIIDDAISLYNVFVPELHTLYKAFCAGLPSPLTELPIQYGDFALWQRQWLMPEVLSPQIAYWKQQLAYLPVLQLSSDSPRPAIQSFKGARQTLALSKSLTLALKELSRREGVTLFMTLLAAFKTLLYRYTGENDIPVGTVTGSRNRPELEGLLGFFLNTLVLRTNMSGNPSFLELLSRVRDVTLEADAHRDLPFEHLVQILQPNRSRSQNPLFNVSFVLEPPMPAQDYGWNVSQLDVDTGTAKFDLTLELDERPEGIIGRIEYSTDLFEAATISRMIGHFQTMLAGIVANPQARVSELPLLTEAERHQLLVEWNKTAKEYPRDKCIHQLFEEQVERTPDAVAVVFEGQQLTYQQLNARANQLAHYLQFLGVGPEVLVGICVERSPAMIVGVLAILKAGGAYVPIDTAYPSERKAFILEDSCVRVLIAQAWLIESFPQHQARVVYLDFDWPEISRHSENNPNSKVTPDNLAYVIYTSGSTGKPKGVLLEHRGLCNLAEAQMRLFEVQPNSRVLQFASFSFDASVWEIFMALVAGATLVLGTQDALMPGPDLIGLLRNCAIATVTLPPSALSVLPVEELPALQTIIVAGEATSSNLVASWAPLRRFFNAYGPTEATICATVALCSDGSQKPPIGRPIANTQAYLLDAQLQPVPIGVPGELYIGGAGLARGYLNRPDLTAEKFIFHPNGMRLYKTGDKARYLPDGNIEFLGRLDNQVKIRGFRIELGEIEAVLSTHPLVRETVVIVREDIQSDKRLVAYLVPQQVPPTFSELRHFLKQKLPDYMIPSAFVILDALPLTPNGKVDRRALPAPASSPNDSTSFVPPRDTVEQQLQRIWSEVLQLTAVGILDNFFELGGHSLLAVRLMAQIQQHFGKNLPLAILFSNPTIEQLAPHLRSSTDSLFWFPLVAIQSGGSKQPFFCVPGIGGNVIYLYELARHLGSDQPFYSLQAKGLDGESEPFTQLSDIAAYYIEAIQSVQPKGPYLLGGHSFGGIVAFEMTQQLQKQGHEVALLAIIDAGAPIVGKNSYGVDENDAGYLTDFASYIGDMLSTDLEVSKEILASLTAQEQLHYLKEQLIRVNLLPLDAGITSVMGLVQVYKANLQANRDYLPQQLLPTRIALFRADEVNVLEGAGVELTQMIKEPALGWNEFSETMEIHVVPGNHMTVMQKPHVQVLAAQLRACLTQAQVHLA